MKEVQKRSLFNKIFGTKNSVSYGTQLEVLNGNVASFTNYDGELYDSTQVRTCIDAIARNGAKLNPKHIRKNKKGYEQLSDNIAILLSERPNDLMNAYDFYYKVISMLYLDNNAYIYIQRDEKGVPTALYPIKSTGVKLYEYNDNVYVQFQFNNGKVYTTSLKDNVIHLKRFYCENDILGGNTIPIVKTMSFYHVIKEGVINAIKTTQGIKGVLKTTKAMLKPDDIKATRDQFVKDFLSGQNGGGIAGLDATTDFKEVNINPQTATDSQVKQVDDEIKKYFGVSDEILQNKYTEEQWNAFYESVLEPIGLMMGLEFTNKLFSFTERFHGNKIVFESNRLQYASNNTKISIAEKMNNFMTINEIREMFNLPPVEDGDKILQDLNHIDSSIANQYQVGDTSKNESNDSKEEQTQEPTEENTDDATEENIEGSENNE